ncbi:hypothetical protein A2635_01245 [Candidatus Peribacteria bacterium RIFCSPHIGHO2_01_FULL_51_9]|nr:MAG: hypothetical protein A2635_01245 [Candidatus Peribacteria bacterium RIFCSPHIGHO2_01_FULL_51_9]
MMRRGGCKWNLHHSPSPEPRLPRKHPIVKDIASARRKNRRIELKTRSQKSRYVFRHHHSLRGSVSERRSAENPGEDILGFLNFLLRHLLIHTGVVRMGMRMEIGILLPKDSYCGKGVCKERCHDKTGERYVRLHTSLQQLLRKRRILQKFPCTRSAAKIRFDIAGEYRDLHCRYIECMLDF